MIRALIRKVTEQKLEKYLNKIGWGIQGNNLNRYIFNDENKNTLFRIWNSAIEVDSKDMFGENYKGSLVLNFQSFWLEYSDDGKTFPMVSLVLPVNNSLKGNKTFISFYGKR